MRLAILMNVRSHWSREIAIRLSRMGVSVTVIGLGELTSKLGYLSREDAVHRDGVSMLEQSIEALHTLSGHYRHPLNLVAGGVRLRKLLRDCRADALFTLYGGSQAAIAYLSGFRPYAVYLVGSDVHLLNPGTRMVGRLAMRGASAVFANGKDLAAVAESSFGCGPVSSYIIGIDTDRFSPRDAPADPVRIVCTRGFEAVYNNDALIRALAMLGDLDRAVEVTFVSAGSQLEAARKLAAELLVGRERCVVSFLGGADDATLRRTLQESHIYVSMSRSDGTSISLLEGMSCGLFPILSDIPANRDWIDSAADNGMLVPLDDPNALARAVRRAVEDDSLRLRARSFNRDLILERADGRKTAAELVRQLEGMARTKAAETRSAFRRV